MHFWKAIYYSFSKIYTFLGSKCKKSVKIHHFLCYSPLGDTNIPWNPDLAKKLSKIVEFGTSKGQKLRFFDKNFFFLTNIFRIFQNAPEECSFQRNLLKTKIKKFYFKNKPPPFIWPQMSKKSPYVLGWMFELLIADIST